MVERVSGRSTYVIPHLLYGLEVLDWTDRKRHQRVRTISTEVIETVGSSGFHQWEILSVWNRYNLSLIKPRTPLSLPCFVHFHLNVSFTRTCSICLVAGFHRKASRRNCWNENLLRSQNKNSAGLTESKAGIKRLLKIYKLPFRFPSIGECPNQIKVEDQFTGHF